MLRVIKIGGSLLRSSSLARRVDDLLNSLSPARNLSIVGGGELIDAVRNLDTVHPFDQAKVHWQCVDLLRTTFHWLSNQLDHWDACVTRKQFDQLCRACLDPATRDHAERHLIAVDSFYHRDLDTPLPENWDTTTDAIAGLLATRVRADELVLLKSCQVDESLGLIEAAERGVVDPAIARMEKVLPPVRMIQLSAERGPMTAILGLSAFYHDSAAALLIDGQIVAAAQEERFSRIKHDAAFPTRAAEYCLRHAGISANDLDYVGFYEKPLQKFDRLLETYLSFAPIGFNSFRKAIPNWVTEKLHLRREIRRGLGNQYKRRIVFCDHHESHAASAFFASPFNEAALLTMDGVGEWATTTVGAGHGNQLSLTHQIQFPHSLGLLYSAFTYYCGFKVNSGEYKLMGLAPYGRPRYVDLIMEHLVRVHDDGSFTLNLDYFGFCQTLRMTTEKFHQIFGRPPRAAETEIESFHQDIAASIQHVTEEIVMRLARHLHQQSGQRSLCMAGGVALNCVANGRLLREGPFDQIWIQPAAGDAGGALGVAQLIWHQLLDKDRNVDPNDSQNGSLLGPSFSSEEVQQVLSRSGAVFEVIEDDETLHRETAKLLAEGFVVGRFAGRAEFGPRALGNRSILGDPRRPEMQSTMNLKIKFRESFRPFAPVVLSERAGEYFDVPDSAASPYMLLVGQTKVDSLPAVTHVDGSARVQTVDRNRNPGFRALLEAFEKRTGCPVLINTSFNVRGEPIVGSPDDALRCFRKTNMDALVIENCLLLKSQQPSNGTQS